MDADALCRLESILSAHTLADAKENRLQSRILHSTVSDPSTFESDPILQDSCEGADSNTLVDRDWDKIEEILTLPLEPRSFFHDVGKNELIMDSQSPNFGACIDILRRFLALISTTPSSKSVSTQFANWCIRVSKSPFATLFRIHALRILLDDCPNQPLQAIFILHKTGLLSLSDVLAPIKFAKSHKRRLYHSLHSLHHNFQQPLDRLVENLIMQIQMHHEREHQPHTLELNMEDMIGELIKTVILVFSTDVENDTRERQYCDIILDFILPTHLHEGYESDEGLCQRFLFCYRFIRKCGSNNVAGDLTRRLISSILCSGSLHTMESSKLKHTAFERPSVCLSLDSLLEDMVADWDNLILRHHILDCISNQQLNTAVTPLLLYKALSLHQATGLSEPLPVHDDLIHHLSTTIVSKSENPSNLSRPLLFFARYLFPPLDTESLLQGNHAYGRWFRDAFLSPSSRLQTQKQCSNNFLKSLISVIPLESAHYLKFHAEVVYGFLLCKELCAEFTNLAKAKLAEWAQRESDLDLIASSPHFNQEQLDRILAAYEKNKVIPENLLQWRVIRQSWYFKEFLPSLLSVDRHLSQEDWNRRCEFVEQLAKSRSDMVQPSFLKKFREVAKSQMRSIPSSLSDLSQKLSYEKKRPAASESPFLKEIRSKLADLGASGTDNPRDHLTNIFKISTGALKGGEDSHLVLSLVLEAVGKSISHFSAPSKPDSALDILQALVKETYLFHAFLLWSLSCLNHKHHNLDILHNRAFAFVLAGTSHTVIQGGSSVGHYVALLLDNLIITAPEDLFPLVRFALEYVQQSVRFFQPITTSLPENDQTLLTEFAARGSFLPPAIFHFLEWSRDRLSFAIRGGPSLTKENSSVSSVDLIDGFRAMKEHLDIFCDSAVALEIKRVTPKIGLEEFLALESRLSSQADFLPSFGQAAFCLQKLQSFQTYVSANRIATGLFKQLALASQHPYLGAKSKELSTACANLQKLLETQPRKEKSKQKDIAPCTFDISPHRFWLLLHVLSQYIQTSVPTNLSNISISTTSFLCSADNWGEVLLQHSVEIQPAVNSPEGRKQLADCILKVFEAIPIPVLFKDSIGAHYLSFFDTLATFLEKFYTDPVSCSEDGAYFLCKLVQHLELVSMSELRNILILRATNVRFFSHWMPLWCDSKGLDIYSTTQISLGLPEFFRCLSNFRKAIIRDNSVENAWLSISTIFLDENTLSLALFDEFIAALKHMNQSEQRMVVQFLYRFFFNSQSTEAFWSKLTGSSSGSPAGFLVSFICHTFDWLCIQSAAQSQAPSYVSLVLITLQTLILRSPESIPKLADKLSSADTPPSAWVIFPSRSSTSRSCSV
eukprot:TRINITY_DN3557_c0_g1_i12.p1 TRINITY_DN3557_c0_g1~~TRINITY_DN3557_c0_g1_i12.p1  ORF type:complete len:1346 (-),score=219.33 TRINITY_DN3557_c0_g1_i12:69-4106(-)